MSGLDKDFQELITRRFKGITVHWNNACDNYFNLDLFLININSAIQELRNLTFLLQKHKQLYWEFDSWYVNKQQEMKSDDKLRWIVDSRNKIVKQEDLSVNSLAYISLVNRKEIILPTIELNPFLSNDEIISFFLELIKEEKFKILSKTMGMPVLQVKKLWIDKDYPWVEVLLLIKHWFDYFKQLIQDFFSLIEVDTFLDEKIDVSELESKKTYFLDVNDSSVISKKVIEITFNNESKEDINKMKDIVKKIIWDTKVPQKINGSKYNQDDVLLSFLEVGKKVIQLWEQHLPTVIYLSKEYKPINIIQADIPDRASKYVWIRWIADYIKNNNDVFAVILVNEARVVSQDNWVKHHDNPSLDTSKWEELMLCFLDKEWLNKDIHLPIYRKWWQVQFWKITETSSSILWFFAPIAEVWWLNH